MPKKTLAERTAVYQVGDNKLPNKYWVSVSSNYLTNKQAKDNHFESASEVYKDLPKREKMIGQYDTFEEAQQVAESQYLPSPDGEWDAYHSVQIEDRLSGTLYEITWWEHHNKSARFPSVTFELERSDDTKYTREEMKKRGQTFE